MYDSATLIVTSNKPFSAWGETFGDEVLVAAMIDRLVHHAEDRLAEGRQLPPRGSRVPATRDLAAHDWGLCGSVLPMPGEDRPPEQRGYALPYYTRDGGDTEYLLSNPGPVSISGSLVVFGPDCKPVGEPVGIKVDPHCTQSVLVRPIVPDHAGHAILAVDRPLVVSIFYVRKDELAVVGNAIAGPDAVVGWLPPAKSRTYAFGYRTQPLGTDTLAGSLFVSNPNTTNLAGVLSLFDQACRPLRPMKFSVRPGCTREFPFPGGRFGYGQVRVAGPAVLNVLHFARSAGGLAAAELLGDANQIPEPPPPGAGLLIDYTHDCRSAATGDLTAWESAVAAAGNTVDRLTTSPVTLAALQPYRAFAVVIPRIAYSASETQAISDFVTAGGGLLIVQDHGLDPGLGGPMPWSWPTRSVMGAFGLVDDDNLARDVQHNDGGNPGRVVYDSARCFRPHPVVAGLTAVMGDATCTFSSAAGWTTIIETDADAVPPNQPVLVERSVGAGRVLVFGDSNSWTDIEIAKYDDNALGVRCCERVLFKI